MKALVQFRETDTGLVLADLVIDYVKRLDGSDVDTSGATLVELGFGAYVFSIPGTDSDAAFRLSLVSDSNVYDAGEFPRLLEKVFSQLIARHESGTILVPGAALSGDTLTLFRQNSYTGLTFTLGSEWSPYLAGGYQVFLTAKRWKTDPLDEALFDVECNIDDAGQGVISADLTPTDLDHLPFDNGIWQIQVVDLADPPTVRKIPMEGKLVILPLVREAPGV